MKKGNASSKKISIEKVTISLHDVQNFTPSQRHIYYLFGLMVNEFRTLQLLLIAAQPNSGDQRVFRLNAELSHVWFFLRIAISKIFEAEIALRSIKKDLKTEFFFDEAAFAELGNLLKQLNASKWLGKIRNQLAFHYPEPDKWRAIEKPNSSNWTNDEIYLSESSSRMFYQGSDHLLISAMLELVEPSLSVANTAKAVDTILGKTSDWVKEFCDLLDQAMARFLVAKIADLNSTEIGTVLASDIKSIRLPYWYFNAKTNSTK
jgi:hypothetical protein